MSWRRIPIFSTLVVLAAVAVMVALGFWQLDRLQQKEALLRLYTANSANPSLVSIFEADNPVARRKLVYRRTQIHCRSFEQTRPMAGHNAQGVVGWSHWANCWAYDHLHTANVNLGWSKGPTPIRFSMGVLTGTIVSDDKMGMRLVADPPLAGLEANARPDPRDMPNNHLAYAVQWFLFALTALVIYAIALRKRLKTS